MKVLGIETSCDDTSVALYDSECGVMENLVSSQVDLHGHFGGVVPELASRAHLVNLLPLVEVLLERQELALKDLDGVAVTAGPGLIGALLVGLSTGKALALAGDLPLVGVHHIEGHILANALTADLVLPAVVLVASGGHTELIHMPEVGRYERLGGTLDDAAGEAFDKTAKLLGLPYPGGPQIDRLAKQGRPGAFTFPRPMLHDSRPIFSFSGLKTAVRTQVDGLARPLADQTVADICYELQEAIVDSLCAKLFAAARQRHVGAVYLAGGVSANGRLRERVAAEAKKRKLHFVAPDRVYSTDNAAMIAYAGFCHFMAGRRDSLDLDSFPRGPLTSLAIAVRELPQDTSQWHSLCVRIGCAVSRGWGSRDYLVPKKRVNMTAKARILVADDEPHIRRILQFLLEQEGFEVQMAEDGEEAWKAVASFQPDLVLLDVMMPRMDGFAVLEIIRAGFETARLPVIMLTAKGEESDKVKGLRGGANDYIIKPFNHDELLLRVSNLLEATRREREANPLTGLPGNRAIEREINARIASGREFSFMYIDIDRFKSFNDHYGYSMGDRAISFLAGVLIGCTQKYGSGWEFVGHVGGDDFVVASDSVTGEGLARRIIEEFDVGKVDLHDPADFERGYLEVESRNGDVQQFPLITLTLALIKDAKGRFEHPAELSDTLVELKRFGKTMPQSVVVTERRANDGGREMVVSGNEPADDTIPNQKPA